MNAVVEEDGWQEEGKNALRGQQQGYNDIKEAAGNPEYRTVAGRHLIPLIIPFAIFWVICFVPSTEFFLCDLPRIHSKYNSS